MELPYALSQQSMKVMERLFVFVDTKDIDQNINLNLVVNPQIIKILLNQTIHESDASKLHLYGYLSDIFSRNRFNSLILAKRDQQIMQFNHSILQSLLSFIFTIKNQKKAREMSHLLTPFIHSYCINGKILKTILSIVIKDFYSEKFNHYILELSLQILINIMRHQSYRQSQPNCYFITYGEETGVKMINKNIKWPFSKGFYLYIKFYIQSTTTEDMVLFNIALESDQFVVFITPEKELKIKVFAQPQVITICTLPVQEWITLTLSYTLQANLLKNYYQVHCIIDGEMHERRNLPFPHHVSMSDEIQELSFGHSFYGLIHTVILSRNQISRWNKLVLNIWQDIQSFLIVNKKSIRDLFVLYHPLLTTCINQKDIIYEITSQNHGQIFQNTGIYINPFTSVDINYYGGLYTFLPYLHLLKFYSHQIYPQALTHTFELFSIFFVNKFVNAENEAIYCQLFSVCSQLINEINSLFITQQTVAVISKINKSITNMLLRKEIFLNFLWKIKVRKIQNAAIVQNILSITQQYFLQFFQWSYGLISIDDVFHYIIDNFEPEHPSQCCFQHYLLSEAKLHPDKPFSSFTQVYSSKTKYLKSILKIICMNLVHFQSIRPINSKIMEILFYNYSPCLKLLLLQSLNEGSKINASFYMQEFNLHNNLYIYLPTTSLPEEIAVIFDCLLHCHQQNEDNQVLQRNIIHRIAHYVEGIYDKRCEDVKFRSRSEKVKITRQPSLKRNFSEQKVVKEVEKRPSKKLSRGSSVENSKGLYEAIIKLCFYYDGAEFSYLLKEDEYVLILQPYFKVCCLAFRKNIIEMIRNTVILASKGKSLIQNLTKFDRLYKMLLNQFVLRQLMPESPDYLPTQENTYIIRNVYFVIDYMIMNIRNDWIHLYIYLLRLIGLLQLTKNDIQKRTERSAEDIFFAVKVTLRKFILRVVKLAQKNIYNLPNLVFIAYLTVFSNELPEEYSPSYNMFRYYKTFQRHLFIGYSVVNSESIDVKQRPTFVDSRLILQTVASFKICFFNYYDVPQIKTLKYIHSYFDLQYTNQDSLLYKNRLIYLTIAQFRPLKTSQNTFKNILNGFFKDNNHEKLSIGQILSIMLGLCIEASLKTDNISLLQESLKSLQDFFSSFVLFCSRDGLKKDQHSTRDTKLPKLICSSVLHFVYDTIQAEQNKEYKRLLQQTLYSIFYFLALLITCLSNKVGNPDSMERCLQLARIQKNVEEYNFYAFQLFNEVITLKDMIQIPNIDKENAMLMLLSDKMSQFFRNRQIGGIEHKIRDVVTIHKMNETDIKAQLCAEFQKNAISLQQIDHHFLINKEQFDKVFVFGYLKKNNLNYRRIQRIWRKIWKRLRLYHYFWSISMDQRQTFQLQYKKNQVKYYKKKCSKFYDENGSRSILQIEPVEPWHVKKMLMQKQFEYRNSNYLYYLHEEVHQEKKKSSIIDKLVSSISNDVVHSTLFFVDWIKNNSKRKGYLSLQQEKLKFKYVSTYQKDSHLQFSSFILAEYKPIEKYWPLIEITDILHRRYLTKKQCILIQFQDHTTLIFNFLSDDKDQFLRLVELKQNDKNDKQALLKLNQIAFYTKKFTYLHPQNKIQQTAHLWRNRQISNFRYLMLLNKYAGRSYLDPANYPVFPWIIDSYDAEKYGYRDLSKSMGALGNQQRRNHFKAKTEAIDPFDPVPAYQFGTHYSSPGMVFNFLIRLNPYTEASRTLQGGKFDLSDRLFNSIKICWHSVNSQLIPEFFYLPEFLVNLEQYNFGVTQQKERVHNVHLAVWSKNAYDFITKHKCQLQSEDVSRTIHQWIDLIFGYKQKGKIAEQHLNLFYYLTYENSINLQSIEDEQTKISKQAQVMHFGQTPSQIFSKPHIEREPSKYVSSFLTNKAAQIVAVLSLQNNCSISLLWQDEKKMLIFCQYSIHMYHRQNQFQRYSFSSETKLLRNNSRQNIYFLQDIDFNKKIILFGKSRFVAIGSYVNGDLIIYSLPEGKRVDEKKGVPKNCIFINKEENLLFCGCKNGLLEVYEIIYCQKQTVTLLKIASQYYQSPIYSISQGGHFYSVISGNLAVIIKISRTLTYVYDKMKMRGLKMLRSIESHKNIDGSLICVEPLFCLIIFNSLEISSYSINGQHLKTLQTAIMLAPLLVKSSKFSDYMVLVEDKKIVIYSTPFLQKIKSIQLPHRNFREISCHHNKLYLCTSMGQVYCVSYNEKEQQF